MDYCVRESTENRDWVPENVENDFTAKAAMDVIQKRLQETILCMDRMLMCVTGINAGDERKPEPEPKCMKDQLGTLARMTELAMIQTKRLAEFLT